MFRRPSRRPFLRPRSDSGVEIIRIPKRSSGRITADTNAASADKPAALFTCESACVRSDIAKLVAEEVCHRLPADRLVRLELDDASAKKPGQRTLVRRFTRATVLEGCSIQCASSLLHDLLPKVDLEVIPVDQFYKLEGNPFGLEDIKPAKQAKIIEQAARGILDALKRDGSGSV
jgi:uncharacterized metal-binding protein